MLQHGSLRLEKIIFVTKIPNGSTILQPMRMPFAGTFFLFPGDHECSTILQPMRMPFAGTFFLFAGDFECSTILQPMRMPFAGTFFLFAGDHECSTILQPMRMPFAGTFFLFAGDHECLCILMGFLAHITPCHQLKLFEYVSSLSNNPSTINYLRSSDLSIYSRICSQTRRK